jgi:hypothetical protein
MQFLTILVATLLGGCALIFVLYPIYERMRQYDRDGQGNHTQGEGKQGDRKGRPYHTRNRNHDRSIVGVGLAPTLKGTPTLPTAPILNGTPTLEHSLDNPLETSTNSQVEREQAARTALQEVELDFQLGNLAETDYRSLRERYMRRALLAMKSRHDREQELDEAIEEQLRRMRETDEQAKE